MIYTINEARNAEEYRAEKAAREKAEQDKKDKQYNSRYFGKNKGDGVVTKTRADGSKDYYHTSFVGSRNREGHESSDGRVRFHGFNDEDIDRDVDAMFVAHRNAKSSKEEHEFSDAANRNMRRHPERWDGDKPVKPKTESTIFDNIEII